MVREKGVYISRISKIAAETDSAQMHMLVITVALAGAKSPKLARMSVSHNTSTTGNGTETEVVPCSNIDQRIWPIPIAMLNACD